MFSCCMQRRVFIFALLLLFSVICFSPLLLSGNWFDSHDGIRYLCLFEQFKSAFEEGIIYPRWLPDNYGGYGYPDFVFYQPGFFYFTLIVSYIFPDTLNAFFASIILCHFLGVVGAFLLLRQLFSDEFASLAGAVLFGLTPYIFVNIYVRGDLAEFASMMITPWLVYFLIIAVDKLSAWNFDAYICFCICSVLIAILVYTHPFTAMFFYPLFLIFAIILTYEKGFKEIKKAFLFAGIVLIGGAVLSALYWLPAALMKDYVNYKNALSSELQAHLHLLYPLQLLSDFWGFDGSAPGPSDGMSFQLGLSHFLLALIGVFLVKKGFLRFIFALYILLIILMLHIAEPIWRIIPILGLVQFPWRILSAVSVVQAICAAAVFLRISQMEFSKKLLVSFAIFAAIMFNYYQMFFMRTSQAPVREVLAQHREGRKFILASYSSFNEFFPVYIKSHPSEPRGSREIILFPEGVEVEKLKSSSPYRYSVVVSNSSPVQARVLQLYFPGMSVRINKVDVMSDCEMLPDGTFLLSIPAGEKQLIEVFYGGTPYDRAISRFVSAFILILLFSAIIAKKMMNRTFIS